MKSIIVLLLSHLIIANANAIVPPEEDAVGHLATVVYPQNRPVAQPGQGQQMCVPAPDVQGAKSKQVKEVMRLMWTLVKLITQGSTVETETEENYMQRVDYTLHKIEEQVKTLKFGY